MEIPNFLKRTQCFSLSDEGKSFKKDQLPQRFNQRYQNQKPEMKEKKIKRHLPLEKSKISRKSTNKSKNRPKIMTNPSNECCLFTNTNDKVTD